MTGERQISTSTGRISGINIQLNGLRQRVDPHWKRGLSYLKIGLRWLKGVLHNGFTEMCQAASYLP